MCSRKWTEGRSAHPISNRNECKAFDQGLLNVSGHSVQLTDASEFATCVHASGRMDDLLIQSPIAMNAKHLIRVS